MGQSSSYALDAAYGPVSKGMYYLFLLNVSISWSLMISLHT